MVVLLPRSSQGSRQPAFSTRRRPPPRFKPGAEAPPWFPSPF